MTPAREFLFSDAGAAYLQEAYWGRRLSLPKIARAKATTVDSVYDAMVHHGIPRRSMAEGRMEAKRNPDDAVLRKVKDPDKAKEHSRKGGHSRWDAMGEAERLAFLAKAGKARQEAALRGSKLELYVLEGLRENGYEPEHRVVVDDEKVDILVRKLGVVVQVFGHTHFARFQAEKHARWRNQDDYRANYLIDNGWAVIHVLHRRKQLNLLVKKLALIGVLDALEQLADPANAKLLFEVEV